MSDSDPLWSEDADERGWLLQLLYWQIPLTAAVSALVLVLYGVTGRPRLLVAAAAITLVVAILLLARRWALGGQVRRAVWLVSAALLTGAPLGALVTPLAATFLALQPILAVTVALPYSSKSQLRRIALVGWLSMLLTVTIVQINRPSEEPSWLSQVVVVAATAASGALLGLLSWQYHHRIRVMLGHLRALTGQLAGSKTALEAEIAARTAELAASEAFLRTIVEDQTELVARFRAGGAITFANGASAQAAGLTTAELVGRDFFATFTPDTRAAVIARLAQLDADRPVTTFDDRAAAPDGGAVWRQWTVRAIAGRDGRVAEYQSVGRDITEHVLARDERARMERKLRETQKLETVGVLAGGIAHDFNNLLMITLGNAQLALADLPAGSPARHSLEQIEQASRRASDLVQQLLVYAGKRRTFAQQTTLEQLVRGMGALLQSSVPRHIEVRYDFDPLGPMLLCDPDQVRQVVLNLLVNAAEAIGEAPGRIALAATHRALDDAALDEYIHAAGVAPGAYALLSVTDDGAGMDHATLDRVFEPFFTTKFAGRGLGMAAVLGMVRAHNGAIRIESAPGRGTTVTVALPLPERQPEAPRAPQLPAPAGPARRAERPLVLVIEDEEAVRTVLERLLDRMGLAAVSAEDGVAGEELFRARAAEVACVLLDLAMPRRSGVATAPLLRAARPDVPIILMSGYSEGELSDQYGRLGFSAFLSKPFTPEALRAALARVPGLLPETPG